RAERGHDIVRKGACSEKHQGELRRPRLGADRNGRRACRADRRTGRGFHHLGGAAAAGRPERGLLPRRRATGMVGMRLAVLAIFLLPAACDARFQVTEAEHAAAIRAWQEQRTAGLKAEDGWLSLVGLYWLETGSNTF